MARPEEGLKKEIGEQPKGFELTDESRSWA
jgi:hypothetical protein